MKNIGFFIRKLGSYLNIYHYNNENSNISPVFIKVLQIIASATCALYTIPAIHQILLYVLWPKYYIDRLPGQNGLIALPKMIFAYFLNTLFKRTLAFFVLAMCRIVERICKNAPGPIFVQFCCIYVFFLVIIYLLYRPVVSYINIATNISIISKKDLFFVGLFDSIALLPLTFIRSSIYHKILFVNIMVKARDSLLVNFRIQTKETHETLAAEAGLYYPSSPVENIESILTKINRIDILDEIKQAMKAQDYDINKVYVYNDSNKLSNAMAFRNSFTDCTLVAGCLIDHFAQNPKAISAVLIHEITHIRNNDPAVLAVFDTVISCGPAIIMLLWMAFKWTNLLSISNFGCIFVITQLWNLILLIVQNLYQNHIEMRADRGLMGTGYEEHMICFLKHFRFPPQHFADFAFSYDYSNLNRLIASHPASLYRAETIKRRT
ncbi:hypothetical protein ENBRE01_3032 [Enteropsectra breve]|nr:hypothetical protein ENBRE01_3032 [Enteropsectra breve]